MNQLTLVTLRKKNISRNVVQAILMLKLGYSKKCVREKTHLTNGVIAYWQRLLGIKLADYRDGNSEQAQQILGLVETVSVHYVEDLRQTIKALPTKVAMARMQRLQAAHQTIDV